jgi:hypothetical protein
MERQLACGTTLRFCNERGLAVLMRFNEAQLTAEERQELEALEQRQAAAE